MQFLQYGPVKALTDAVDPGVFEPGFGFAASVAPERMKRSSIRGCLPVTSIADGKPMPERTSRANAKRSTIRSAA